MREAAKRVGFPRRRLACELSRFKEMGLIYLDIQKNRGTFIKFLPLNANQAYPTTIEPVSFRTQVVTKEHHIDSFCHNDNTVQNNGESCQPDNSHIISEGSNQGLTVSSKFNTSLFRPIVNSFSLSTQTTSTLTKSKTKTKTKTSKKPRFVLDGDMKELARQWFEWASSFSKNPANNKHKIEKFEKAIHDILKKSGYTKDDLKSLFLFIQNDPFHSKNFRTPTTWNKAWERGCKIDVAIEDMRNKKGFRPKPMTHDKNETMFDYF